MMDVVIVTAICVVAILFAFHRCTDWIDFGKHFLFGEEKRVENEEEDCRIAEYETEQDAELARLVERVRK